MGRARGQLESSRLGRIGLLAACLLVWGGPAAFGQASPPSSGSASLFEKSCYSCHNIGGGDKKGPDLQGLTQRRSREWVLRYVPSAQKMHDSGDPTAKQLFSKYAPEVMPDQLLSPDQINQILDMIAALSAKKQVFFPQSGRLARPPRPSDIPVGRAIFAGERRVRAGIPMCISCHGAAGVGALGGGTLGPDLTGATLKYKEVELASILKSPAFPIMSKVFAGRQLSDEEVVQVFAYLKSLSARAPDTSGSGLLFVLLAATGTVGLFLLSALAWKGRLGGVRRELVRKAR